MGRLHLDHPHFEEGFGFVLFSFLGGLRADEEGKEELFFGLAKNIFVQKQYGEGKRTKASCCVVGRYKCGGHDCNCGVNDEKWRDERDGEGLSREVVVNKKII